MKTKFLNKVLAGILVASLVLPAVPATDTYAATKPTSMKTLTAKDKKKTRHTLALGEIKGIKSAGKKSTVNVSFKPAKAGKGIRITSDDTSVVRVYRKNASSTSWTMMGVSEGNANLSIRSTLKSSLKTNFKVYVKSKAPSSIKLSKSSLTLNERDLVSIGAMNKKTDVNVTFNNTKVDRYLNVTSSDENIVSVSKRNDKYFTLMAKKGGTANITIASATKPSVSQNLTVTVKSPTVVTAFSAKQQKDNEVLVTFSAPQVPDPSINYFTLQQKNAGNWNVSLTKITMSNDKKSAVLTTAIPLQASAEYVLTYAPTGGQAQTTEFKASSGQVTRLALKTTTVVQNIPKKLEIVAFDEQGTEISNDQINSRIEVKVNTNQGYFDSNTKTLTLWGAGVTANVSMIYHTYQYNNGVEQTINGTGVVTSIASSNVSFQLDKVAVKATNSRPLTDSEWNATSQLTNIQVPADSVDKMLAVRVKSSEGSYYASDALTPGAGYATFTFKSSNPNIIDVTNAGNITVSNSAQRGQQAVIIISVNFEGKTTPYTITLMVGEASRPTYPTLTPPTGTAVAKGTTAKFELTVKDQYFNDCTEKASQMLRVESANGASVVPTMTYNRTTKKIDITLDTTGLNSGASYPYQIRFNDASNNVFTGFTVTVY